jgi:putative tricarboxylic transport membrane protein
MNIGPDFFPRLIAAGLFIFSGVLIVSNLLSREEDTVVRFDIKDPGVQRAGIALLASIVYGLLVETFGFILTTIVYLVFLMYVMKLRKWKKMGLVAVMVSLLVFLVFRVFLHITLPDGFWA